MNILPLAVLSGLFFGSFGVFSAVWTGLFIVRGEFFNAVVALGVSAFCFAFLIPFLRIVPGSVTPRGDFDDDDDLSGPIPESTFQYRSHCSASS